jgi:predicted DCC family thiol-disulfide oxidoreductase YuxK
VRFVLRHDLRKIFRFASLQSPFASRILEQKGVNVSDLNSVYIVVLCEDREELLNRSEAVLFVMERLGPFSKAFSGILRLVPRSIRDWAYGWVARTRYRWFGKYEACPLPNESDRDRFVGV